MKVCNECSKYINCTRNHTAGSNYAEVCLEFDGKRISNFEHIKQMDIDELAELLATIMNSESCPEGDSSSDNCNGDCIKCWWAWLESEASSK